jgi:hypothetical protein
MVYNVYRLDVGVTFDKHYRQSKYWNLNKDKTFLNENQAKEYVRHESRYRTTMIKLCYDKLRQNKVKTMDEFCFHDDQYFVHRRYFLNVPSNAQLKRIVSFDGDDF